MKGFGEEERVWWWWWGGGIREAGKKRQMERMEVMGASG